MDLGLPLKPHQVRRSQQGEGKHQDDDDHGGSEFPRTQGLGGVFLSHQEPRSAGNRLQRGDHWHPPIVAAPHQAGAAQNRHHRRHIRLAQGNAKVQRGMGAVPQFVEE